VPLDQQVQQVLLVLTQQSLARLERLVLQAQLVLMELEDWAV
jgi:hypothetical protein